MNEVACDRLFQYMEECGFTRFFLYRPENFAWLTGGGDNTVAIGEGVGWLEIEAKKVRVHSSQIEASRFVEEEATGLEIVSHPWYTAPRMQRPNDLDHDLTKLRLVLSSDEQRRLRSLGRDAARALEGVMRAARPDWTERALASHIAAMLYEREIQPIVLLTAGEERMFQYRHPLPKDYLLNGAAMGVVCGRRGGLVINLTRIRVWNQPRVFSLYEKVLYMEAKALDASVPGARLGEVVEAIKKAYRKIGRLEAFEEHHQGGIAGYRPREILGVPGEKTQLAIGMCLAWNPSLPGAKVEDTFLLTEEGLENLTHDPDWPMVTVNGHPRPTILTD
ncbi:MAG: M24 family metallopeptidase [candidate division WOR-3 bacterium]|nr:M24 family metallopeptidase [candidate division WOR-3 bacterium]